MLGHLTIAVRYEAARLIPTKLLSGGFPAKMSAPQLALDGCVLPAGGAACSLSPLPELTLSSRGDRLITSSAQMSYDTRVSPSRVCHSPISKRPMTSTRWPLWKRD